MSDPGCEAGVETLRGRLPAGWGVETFCEGDDAGNCADAGKVRGYLNSVELAPQERGGELGISFEIRRDGDLWTAIWLDRRGSSREDAEARRVTGIRERCVEWVVERARDTVETDGE